MGRALRAVVACATALLGARVVHAASLSIPDPLVERLARGEALPTTVRLRDVVAGRYVDRVLEAREAAMLRALAAAQAGDDAGAFREALRSAVPWIAVEALAGLSHGRTARGHEAHATPLRFARAGDAAFVASLLPEIAALGRAPPGRLRSWHSTLQGRSAECLALLAATTRVADVRARAMDALVENVVATGDEEALRALGTALADERIPPLSDGQKTSLRPVVEGYLARGRPPGLPDSFDSVVASVDVSLVDAGRPPGTWPWSIALVKAGHTPAIQEARRMPRSPRAADREAAAAVADRVVDPESAPAFYALLAATKPDGDRAEPLIRALEMVRGRDLLEAQVARDLRSPDGGHLPLTAEALLRLDPKAAGGLRAALPGLSEVARAKLLCALIRSGLTDLLPRVRETVDGGRAGWQAFGWALRALGAGAARDPGSTEDFLRLDRVWRSYPVRRGPGTYVHVDAVLGPLLLAYREAGRLPAASESLLVDSLGGLRLDASFFAESVVETLGAVGGPASEAVLRELCVFEPRLDRGGHSLRIVCREAVGHVETRTGR